MLTYNNSKTCSKQVYLNKIVGETEIQLFRSRRSVFSLMSTIPGKKDVGACTDVWLALRLLVFVSSKC